MTSAKKSSCGLVAAVMLFLLMCGNAASAGDESNSAAGLAVYSDMSFIADEREFVGLQVTLVPYYNDDTSQLKLKILWRSAGPFLNSPMLLDVDQQGKTFKVVVPEGQDLAGAWTLTLKGDVLYAVRSGSSKYTTLKKISLK